MKKKKGKAHVTEKSWRDGREREVVNPVKREVKKKNWKEKMRGEKGTRMTLSVHPAVPDV